MQYLSRLCSDTSEFITQPLTILHVTVPPYVLLLTDAVWSSWQHPALIFYLLQSHESHGRHILGCCWISFHSRCHALLAIRCWVSNNNEEVLHYCCSWIQLRQFNLSIELITQQHTVMCITQTSWPWGLKILGCSVVLHTRWRMVVLPALARPMISTRKCCVFLRKFSARILCLCAGWVLDIEMALEI